MKQVLVIGSEGQLGNEIKHIHEEFSQFNLTFTTIETLDVTNEKDLEQTIASQPFAYIINCTAYTAVDKAEEELELANKINNIAVGNIGKFAANQQSKVIHVSTDYVFDGKGYKPYVEDESTCPQSAYGQTKLDGEKALLKMQPESIIIRTSWLYSSFGNNFVKTMLRLGKEKSELGVIFDQVGTPTYARDLARTILTIIDSDISNTVSFTRGIYHYSNEGVCSWYDFTKVIHEIGAIECKVSPIETKDYPTAAPRPHYSVLNKSKIKKVYNIDIPYWKDSLKDCIALIK